MSTTAEQAVPSPAPELTATYLWGYDAEAGRFSAEWFDSNAAGPPRPRPAGRATAWSFSAR